jgi:hypothetical protein
MIDRDKNTSLLPDLINYGRREVYIHFASINLKEGKIILNKFFSKSFRNLKVSGIKKSFVFFYYFCCNFWLQNFFSVFVSKVAQNLSSNSTTFKTAK